MRLKITKSPNAASLYVIKSTYEKGVRSTKIVEKLGTVAELTKTLNGRDPIEWAKEYIEALNRQEKEDKREVIVKYSPSKTINKGERRSFNGGYLFLQNIYHALGLPGICKDISRKHKFTFDLDAILSRLIYGRILYPSSKRATHELSQRLIERPNIELQHIYRALGVLAKETDLIQSRLYAGSLNISKRNTSVLYYDCTNFFFEIEQENGLKRYGKSKEHRPNPIVQMGLFMDRDGIPLAFGLNSGNTNEQTTLRPLEEKILSDFKLSKFIVCTDAGLASYANKKFNDKGYLSFIITQPIKKLKKPLTEWALASGGWRIGEDPNTYDITEIDEDAYKDKIFYKERWVNENELEEKLIVTYSIKYRNYQRQIRNGQIERAMKAIESDPGKINKTNQNDYRRFIAKTHSTQDGEAAKNETLSIDKELVAKEEAFDGFYGVSTNLDEDAYAIAEVNRQRWEIEECFRIMKTEFKARPVYLSRDDRIVAHFTVCFLALAVYRLIEKKLGGKFTCCEIIDGLREMNFYEIKGEGYVPTYTRNDFTDALHEAFGFRTDYQIVNVRQMKNIFKMTKS
jgi:transposase